MLPTRLDSRKSAHWAPAHVVNLSLWVGTSRAFGQMLRQWALWLKFDFEGTEQNMMILLFCPHSVAALKQTEASLRQTAMAKPSSPKQLHLLDYL